MDKIRKSYKIINIVVICLAIYIFLFPLIAKGLEFILPNSTKCVYLSLTGRPCPLCGGTRYIKGLPTIFTDITYLFSFFGFVVIVAFLEIIFRIINLFKRNNEKYIKKIIKFDIGIHILIGIIFIIYEIIFLLNP